MSGDEDPRWHQVQRFLEWLQGNDDSQQFLERWQRCMATLASIATDPTAPADQRSTAQLILDDFATKARKLTAETLMALATVADDPSASAEDRATAQLSLETILVKLRDIIDDPETPDDVRKQAVEGRRRFLAS